MFGAGVEALGRSLLITGGQLAGSVTAQWLDRDGTALTGEFELLTGFVPGASVAFGLLLVFMPETRPTARLRKLIHR